ncbi:MAG: methionyl-tRNA formyltransferase [Acidimicrobiia bacterium]
MRAVFLGTPSAAVPALRRLGEIAEIGAVVTRPDAARGRSGRPQPSAVAQEARFAGLPVLTPASRTELTGLLSSIGPVDVGVVVAYGMILRPEHLAWPARGFVNIHFSLLPRWRGAAPVQRAVLAGDERTGVTLMVMDQGLDTGGVLANWSTAIGTTEDAAALTDRLAAGGAGLLASELQAWVDGRVAIAPQDDKAATYADKLTSDERWIRPTMSVAVAGRAVRGLTPWPGAWIDHDGGPVRILAATPTEIAPGIGRIEVDGDTVVLGFEGGGLRVWRLQPAGKRAMNPADWVRGLRSGSDVFR